MSAYTVFDQWIAKQQPTFCMCCGDPADLQNSDEGYSLCCNDRISDDPCEHPDYEGEA